MNECADNVHNCHSNASCTNTNGAFTCSCKSGFVASTRIVKCLLFTRLGGTMSPLFTVFLFGGLPLQPLAVFFYNHLVNPPERCLGRRVLVIGKRLNLNFSSLQLLFAPSAPPSSGTFWRQASAWGPALPQWWGPCKQVMETFFLAICVIASNLSQLLLINYEIRRQTDRPEWHFRCLDLC